MFVTAKYKRADGKPFEIGKYTDSAYVYSSESLRGCRTVAVRHYKYLANLTHYKDIEIYIYQDDDTVIDVYSWEGWRKP